MSTVPNYVGTTSEVQGTNNIEALGSNVNIKLGPKNVHYDKPEPLPSLFVSPLPKDRFEVAEIDKETTQAFASQQDKLFNKWPENLKTSWVPGVLDYPIELDNEPKNAFDEYADTILRHNALFNLKILRKSNF